MRVVAISRDRFPRVSVRCRCPTFFTTFVPATEAETPRAFACVCDPPRPATSPNLQPIRAGTFLKSKDLVNDRSGGRLQLAMRHTDLLSEASPETEPPIVASESVPPGWRPRPTVGSRGGGPGSPPRPDSTGTKKMRRSDDCDQQHHQDEGEPMQRRGRHRYVSPIWRRLSKSLRLGGAVTGRSITPITTITAAPKSQ